VAVGAVLQHRVGVDRQQQAGARVLPDVVVAVGRVPVVDEQAVLVRVGLDEVGSVVRKPKL
jgi:hypothetical protein